MKSQKIIDRINEVERMIRSGEGNREALIKEHKEYKERFKTYFILIRPDFEY